jgi:hypothetical protein
MVLNFDVGSVVRQSSLVLFPDSLDRKTARRLRIQLHRLRTDDSKG